MSWKGGQKRGADFGGGKGGTRMNFGNSWDNEDMMAGMMMAMMSMMQGSQGSGGGQWKKKQVKGPSQPQKEQPWKAALQQALRADGKGPATFASEETDTEAHKWMALVTIDGEQADGRGRGKADAEHSAARNALRQLYPGEYEALLATINEKKVLGTDAQKDPKARLHHGTQLFVRKQSDRNMTAEDIKYELERQGARWQASVILPDGLEGPYVGKPSADRALAEEAAASAALEALQGLFEPLNQEAVQRKKARLEEREAKFAEESTGKKPVVVKKAPSLKLGAKKEPQSGGVKKLGITLKK